MRHAYDLQEIGKHHFVNIVLVYIFGEQSLTHLIQSSTKVHLHGYYYNKIN